MLKKLLALTCLLLTIGHALADEADIRKAVESKLGVSVESVNKSGYLGLYEVYADGNILYTDEKVTAILYGAQLLDTKSMTNVTEERRRKLSAIKFNDLPFDNAIKQVRGNGSRVIATFEDPNCGYCKTLARELQKVDNVTIYTFLYPILSEDSERKARQIWCSANRAKAWNEWMAEGKTPMGRDDCDVSALNKNKDLARKLKINGTPTIFFGDGERSPGAMPLARIEQKLRQVK